MEVSFHLDESFNPIVADALRRYGIDASSSRQVGLLGAADQRQLEFAIAKGRVLASHDVDFGLIHKVNQQHAGIVIIQQRRYSVGEIVRILALIHGCITAEEIRSQIEFFLR